MRALTYFNTLQKSINIKASALLIIHIWSKSLYSVYFTAEKYVKGNKTSEERETKLQRMIDRLAAENSEERD